MGTRAHRVRIIPAVAMRMGRKYRIQANQLEKMIEQLEEMLDNLRNGGGGGGRPGGGPM